MRIRGLRTMAWGLFVLAVIASCGGGPSRTEGVGPVSIDYGDDPAQFGWLRIPEGPVPDDGVPVVVLVHGGFWSEPWDYTLMTPMAEALDARGVATWNIEFRRLGGRGGWPGTFDDVSAALIALVDVAEDHPIDVDRVVIAGHSSGGHLALWSLTAAGDHNGIVEPVAAIGISAVTDLDLFGASAALLGGGPDEVPERWAYAMTSRDPTRALLVHGSDDRIVPVDTIATSRGAGVPVRELAGRDHFEVIEPGPGLDDVVDEIVQVVDALG